MLQFYKNSLLTLPVTNTTPKWFSFPLEGQIKTSSLWLGDPYFTTLSQASSVSDTVLHLTQIDELPSSGTVKIGTDTITYTGRTSTTITGCSGTTHTHTIGSSVFPVITYTSSGNVTILVSGMFNGPSQLALEVPSTSFGLPGVPIVYSFGTITSGVAGAIQINLQITLPNGIEAEYTNLGITVSALTRPGDVGTSDSTITSIPLAPIFIQQRDQGLVQRLRLLPANRQVLTDLPGFEWGKYRWRDSTTENASAVIPTTWDIDTDLVGPEKFIAGVGSIGEANDLQPIDLEEENSSVFLRVNSGQYFTGVNRYYLPSDKFVLEFLPCGVGHFQFTLQQLPREQTPIFVGTWLRDGQGFYEYGINYRYVIGEFDTTDHSPRFVVSRKTGVLTISKTLTSSTILVGLLSGQELEEFDIPVYPVDRVTQLYIDNPRSDVAVFTFNRDNGSISFPKVSGTVHGQPVYIVCDPAIAVLYEVDSSDTTEITNTDIADLSVLKKDTRLLSVDLNPAFSGLARGFVYLQHRVFKPTSLTLSCDKPQIGVPPTLSSIIGLIAYGPVFYNGDYALLTVTAFDNVPGEVVPGAVLQVIPGGLNPGTNLPYLTTPFRGLINGQDPNTETITVVTGGDGVANLVYLPEPDFGYYIPTSSPWITTTTVARDTVQLPVPIPISQLRGSTEGWLVYIYQVLSNNPLFGLVGGSPAAGQLPFVTNGTISGSDTILSVGWASGVLTYTLATPPTNLELNQNILVTNCTTSTLNGVFSVLGISGNSVTVASVSNPIFPASLEIEGSATLKYSNFRTNGVLQIESVSGSPIFPIHAYDNLGNDYTSGGFNGQVVKLVYSTSLTTDINTQAYFLQFLERQVIQLQVMGTNILSNTIMLQMQAPDQILSNPYLVLSNASGVTPTYPLANLNSRLNINRLGIIPDVSTVPLSDRSSFPIPE